MIHDQCFACHICRLEELPLKLVCIFTTMQCVVNVEDFRRARPDFIAHSAANIISRLEAGGEKIVQAFKSLCWRCKGIIVEVIHYDAHYKVFLSRDLIKKENFHLLYTTNCAQTFIIIIVSTLKPFPFRFFEFSHPYLGHSSATLPLNMQFPCLYWIPFSYLTIFVLYPGSFILSFLVTLHICFSIRI